MEDRMDDITGRLLFFDQFDDIEQITSILYIVRIDKLYGVFCPATSTFYLDVRWVGVRRITDTLWEVSDDDVVWGVFCTETQSVIVPIKWRAVIRHTDIYWAVTDDGVRWGVFCTAPIGLLLDVRWVGVRRITDTLWEVSTDLVRWGVFCTETQSVIVPIKWRAVIRHTDIYWAVTDDGVRWGVFCTAEQDLIIQALYVGVYCYNESGSRIEVWDKNRWYWYDAEGKCFISRAGKWSRWYNAAKRYFANSLSNPL